MKDNRMLQTFAVLLMFQTIGEILSYSLHLPIPGPVIGMVLLLLWLLANERLLPVIAPTSQELLRHLSLLFVPAGVGIMAQAHTLSGQWLAIVVALVVSTALTITVTALVTQALIRWQEKRRTEHAA
ncbi:murein hydrolase transporter LrgA [Pandoraea thiooxydans]|nr:murein hydrolase transporter LrgA [Pandoraea thiooxydans]